jgi:hypothetical protein
MLDRMAVSGMMAGLILIAVLLGIDAALMRLACRRPLVVPFIGSRRLARVLAISVLGPIAAYAIYAYATSIGGRQYGAAFSIERLGVEYATVAVACVILTRMLTDRALSQRLAEIGSDSAPPAPGRGTLVTGLLLAIGIAAYIRSWWVMVPGTDPGRDLFPTRGYGLILALLIVLYGLHWLWPAPLDEPSRQFRRAAFNGAGLVLGLVLLASAAVIWNTMGAIGGLAPAITAINLAIGLTLLGLCIVRFIRRRNKGSSPVEAPMISHSLPLALSLALAACCFAFIAGLPLRYAERQAVQAMAAPGGSFSCMDELDLSRLRQVQDRLVQLLAHEPPAS